MRAFCHLTPRLAVIVAAHLVVAAPALAQVRVATLDDLRRELSPGDLISITRTTGEPVTGRLLRFGDTEIDIRVDSRQDGQSPRLGLTVPRSAIRSLERPRDSSRNGALIGGGVGAGVGLAMFAFAASVDRNEMDEWGPAYLAGTAALTGLGALVGWAVDAAHSKPHLRYDAPGSTTTKIGVRPLLARARGLALVVSF